LAEAGRPGASTPLAADDMIGSLAARVRELSLRVAQLEGELEAARRRIGVYEDFDAQVQDSLSAALRAANQIRERAHVTAEALAQEARAQRPGTATELDAIRLERDALRRVIDDASSGAPSRAAASPAPSFPMSEMRVAATEALRGVFKELVAEIRAAGPAATPAVVQSVPSPQPTNSPSTFVPSHTPGVPAVQRPASAPPPTAPTPVVAAAPQPTPAPVVAPPVQQWTAPTLAPVQPVQAPAPQQPYSAPPSSYNVPTEQPVRRPTVVPPPAELVEDVDVAPAAAAPLPPPQPIAAAPAPAPQPQSAPAQPAQTYAPPATEPIGEVQVVLSPISSFPRLVELERRLQGMSVVRTVYARDFRNGVATLAIGLRHPMTVDEFAAAVTKLEYPRLRIVSTSGYVLELRIDSEASSIA